MASTSNDTSNTTTQTTIERIGLYSDDAYNNNSTPLGTNNPSSNTEEQSQTLPIVLKQLLRKGYKPGDACPLEVINGVDNMNYYGAEASLDMLTEIQILLKHHGETKSSDDDDNDALTILDVGSGFGGTARVMLSALNDNNKSKAYCIELQKHIHDTARILSDMACKDPSNHLTRNHIIHIQGNVVSDTSFVMEQHANDGSSSSTTTLDDTFFQTNKCNVIVSRLAVLHIPKKDRQTLFQRLSNWCQPGAVLILEDFALSDDDGPLSKKTTQLLRDEVYVPNGTLPTLLEYQTTLEECGFQNVEFQNCTERWGQFVKERYQAAETNKEAFDNEMGGPGRREFYHAINKIFDEALDTNNPSGFVGVKVYAIKK